MLGKIAECLRYAVALEIVRGCADHPVAGRKSAGDEAGVVEFRHPDGKVDALANDVDNAVGEMKLEIEFRMLLKEAAR